MLITDKINYILLYFAGYLHHFHYILSEKRYIPFNHYEIYVRFYYYTPEKQPLYVLYNIVDWAFLL